MSHFIDLVTWGFWFGSWGFLIGTRPSMAPDNVRCSRGTRLCLVDCGLGVVCLFSLGWVSLDTLARVVVGVVYPLCQVVGLFSWLSILCPVCGLVCDWFAGWQLLFLFGLMQKSYVYRGGAVRFWVFLGTCFLYDCL